MAFETQPVNFNAFLGRKYALLQQQADAGTTQANSGALAAAAAARLDNTRADLAPAESKANIGLTQAQTGLVGNQAKIVIPESQSRIALQDSQKTGQDLTNQVTYINEVKPGPAAPTTSGALGNVLGPAGYSGFRLAPEAGDRYQSFIRSRLNPGY